MAILSAYPELEVTVEVDGQPAQEYDAPADEVEARKKDIDFYSIPEMRRERSQYIIKYIESKPGKRFAFKFDSTHFAIPSSDGKKHLVGYQCILDGTPTAYYPLVGGTKAARGFYMSGNNWSGWKCHNFQFSTLEIVEGDDIQVDRTKEYGLLLVKLWHVVDLQRKVPKQPENGPAPVQAVSEKALKGKSVDSKVNFNSEPLPGPQTACVIDFVDPAKRPFAIFEFRYRSMEGLMSEGIFPRPANEDDQVIELENDPQVQQPPARVKPEPEKTRDIKSEQEYPIGIKPDPNHPSGIKTDPDHPRGVKRERMDPTPLDVCYKLRRLKNGKVEIDLTDD